VQTKIKYFLLAVAVITLLGATLVAADFAGETPSVQRWVDYGVFPVGAHEHLDRNITYHGFALLMDTLLGYELDEKFTFNTALMYIRRHEAFNLVKLALGGRPMTFYDHGGFLTFGGLADILDELIQIYVTDDFSLNLADVVLDGALVINHNAVYVDALVANVSGGGDIVIVGRYDNTIFLDNVDITGNIVITASRHGLAQMDVRNTRANGLYIFGDTNVNLMSNTEIGKISIFAPTMLNTAFLSSRAEVPNVFIATADTALSGRFGELQIGLNKSNAPMVIVLDGQANHLHAEGNVIIVGDAEINSYQAKSLRFINQAGLYRQQEISAAIEMGVQAVMAQFMQELLEVLARTGGAQATQGGSAPSFNFTPTPPIITPPPRDPDPKPYE